MAADWPLFVMGGIGVLLKVVLLWELQRSPRRAFVHDAIGSKP
jgi:hypothetical protein